MDFVRARAAVGSVAVVTLSLLPTAEAGSGAPGGDRHARLRTVQGQHPGPRRLRRPHPGLAEQRRTRALARGQLRGGRLHGRSATGSRTTASRVTASTSPRSAPAFPDQMYIVSAHLDGRGGGGAANDDASGCSLVLEAARALAGLQTDGVGALHLLEQRGDRARREQGLREQRGSLQGIETPPGSGIYPEPRVARDDPARPDPVRPRPAAAAEPDPRRRHRHRVPGVVDQRRAVARSWPTRCATGNQKYSTDYPAQIGSNMNYTDSVPFQNDTAAVSVRDNQRVAEIGNGLEPALARSRPTSTRRSPRPTSVSASTPSR